VFFVILAGNVAGASATTDDIDNRHVIRVHGPRRFLGEFEGDPFGGPVVM
jgi:thioredoxin reductase (NADPH)